MLWPTDADQTPAPLWEAVVPHENPTATFDIASIARTTKVATPHGYYCLSWSQDPKRTAETFRGFFKESDGHLLIASDDAASLSVTMSGSPEQPRKAWINGSSWRRVATVTINPTSTVWFTDANGQTPPGSVYPLLPPGSWRVGICHSRLSIADNVALRGAKASHWLWIWPG
jgi:hypothetical protein